MDMVLVYDPGKMEEFNQTATFIVKIWVEENDLEVEKVWRGYITHVTSGTRKYVKNLDEIKLFIDQYIKSMGRILGG